MRVAQPALQRSILLPRLPKPLQRELQRAIGELHPQLIDVVRAKDLESARIFLRDERQRSEPKPPTKSHTSCQGAFETAWKVLLREYRISTDCGRLATAGQLIITTTDEQEIGLQLTIYRYLCTLALVKKSENFKGRKTIDPTRPSFKCFQPHFEIVFQDYAHTHPSLKSYLKNRIKFSDDIYHIKKAFRDAGIKGLIKGTLRTGLYLDTAPENVSFQPAVQWNLRTR